jgi:hypothetical protein
MDNERKEILAKGLSEGYAGHSQITKGERAGFSIEMTDYEGPEGKYHDEWAADYNGGGQELGKTPAGEGVTRLYGGGTLAEEELAKLGLTKDGVIGKLISFVGELKGGTRLDENADATDGEWSYSYRVLRKVQEIPVDLGAEEIKFKDNLVFIHFHIISPVK